MIRLAIITCLIGFFLSLICAQNYSARISDFEIIDFIKNNKKQFGGNRLDNKISPWNRCDIYQDFSNCWSGDFIQKKSDTIITNEILDLIHKEFESINFETKVFKEIKSKRSKKKYLNISIPIILESENIALVKLSYWCGDECGSGGILILRFENGKWRKIDYRCTWLS